MYDRLKIKVEAIAEKYADLVDKRISTALREDLETGVVMTEVTDGIRMLAHVATTLERIDRMRHSNLTGDPGELNDSDIEKIAGAIAGASHGIIKKPADNELQPHCQLEKSYESILENGTTIHVHITMNVSGDVPESTEKILSEFAKYSRSFYLDAGKDLNSKP